MNFLILGMPNVGKTSIYNLITGDEHNITHKTIGTTRNWHQAYLKSSKNIKIFDTPGIIKINKDKIDNNIKYLISIIDSIIYVIDYKNNDLASDKELLKQLRKFNKEIILLVNKDDNFQQDKNIHHFGYKNIFFLSCAHKLGVTDFLNFLDKFNLNNEQGSSHEFSVGIFGKTNVGKSTLLNKLVGYNRSLVSDKPKTTTDIVNSTFKYKEVNYLIKDTAGLIKKNKIDKNSLDYFATKKTLSIINNIDIILFLIDVQQGFDNQSKKIFNLIYSKSNIFIFIINKTDLLKTNKKTEITELKKDIELQFSQSKNIFILPISAFNKNDINQIKKYIHRLNTEIATTLTTSQINQWLKKSVNKNPHSRIKGKEVKFKYATQILHNPLTIKIFANTNQISSSYKRYLLNQFFEYFKIKSKNVKIVFSKSTNPYN